MDKRFRTGAYVTVLASLIVGVGTLVPVNATASDLGAVSPGQVLEIIPQDEGWRGQKRGYIVDYAMSASPSDMQPASGAVFIPEGMAPPEGWPIVVYGHGTSGMAAGCGGQTNSGEIVDFAGIQSDDQVGTWNDDQMIDYLIGLGVAVVAPDYLGLGRFNTGPHPYLARFSEATALIDLVRAASAQFSELSNKWAALGVSQGGHAALSAAHLGPEYSQELDFRGVIAVDPASDLEKVLPILGPYVPELPFGSNSEIVTYIMQILSGVRVTHPESDVDSYLTDRGRDFLDRMGTMCEEEMRSLAEGVPLGTLLSRPLSDPQIRQAIDMTVALPVDGYQEPVLLLMNATDISVPSPLHASLSYSLSVNNPDVHTIVGYGSHTQLDDAMLAEIPIFFERIGIK